MHHRLHAGSDRLKTPPSRSMLRAAMRSVAIAPVRPEVNDHNL